MNQLERDGILAVLVDKLQSQGSWCGETHVQKGAYFLQELFDVPLGFDFVMYKHGPFSFDLHDDLTSMLADDLLRQVPRPAPYGPSLVTSTDGEELATLLGADVDAYRDAITAVAGIVGPRGVTSLEEMSTALWVLRESPSATDDELAERMNSIKPHISVSQAKLVVNSVRELVHQASASH